MKAENSYVLIPVNFLLEWIEEKTKINKEGLELLIQRWSTTQEETKKQILYDIIRRHKLILSAIASIKETGDEE